MRQSSPVTLRVDQAGAAPARPAANLRPTLTSPARLIASPIPANERLCFDGFVLSRSERQLTYDGAPVELGGRTFDLLLALVEQPGRVISKRELIGRVWPDVAVEDVALRFHMTRLRKALGDGRGGRRLITTQVGVGYGFVAAVKPSHAWPSCAPPRPRRAHQARLPTRLSHLVGREHDQQAVADRIAHVQMLTIVGPPGVGKTSLAIEAAHDVAPTFADGAVFVDLAAVQAPDMLVPGVASALGLTVAANSPALIVLDHLRDRRQLLVLDSGEHLLPSLAWLCEQIVATAPSVRVIVTSRQALRARSEQVYKLAPHSSRAAVDLFTRHLRTAGGVMDSTPCEARAIEEICGRFEGLALPIELAAIRAATHGVAATARMLGDPLSLAWPGRRTAVAHQQTLKASLDWSVDRLSSSEQAVFARASMLDGPFCLDALLAVMTNDNLTRADVAAAMDALVEKSLIVIEAGAYRCPAWMKLYVRERWSRAQHRLRAH